MKNIVLSVMAICLFYAAQAQDEWEIDKAHTSISFSVTHMVISEVSGEFKSFSAKVSSSKDDFSDMQVEFTIEVNSLTTGNNNRDNNLMSDAFFNADKYPKITFKSTSVKKVGDNKYFLEGDLTIRDVTKKITFLVIYNGTVKDNKGRLKAGFKATASINRFDYNLQWNQMIEAGPVVGKDVNITVNVELGKK